LRSHMPKKILQPDQIILSYLLQKAQKPRQYALAAEERRYVCPMSTALRIRNWEKLDYLNPNEVLSKLREVQVQVAQSSTPYKLPALRTNKLKPFLEGRQAALFCHGLSVQFGSTVFFCMTEDEDYDFVAC
jgi:hypothetical protein